MNARVHGVFTGRDRGCIASEGLENTVSRCDEDVDDAFGSLRGSRDVRTHRERRVSDGHRCRGKLNIRTEATNASSTGREDGRTFGGRAPGDDVLRLRLGASRVVASTAAGRPAHGFQRRALGADSGRRRRRQ